jgi:hypothetical protein
MSIKSFLSALLLLPVYFISFAQNPGIEKQHKQLYAYEDSLKTLSFQIINNENELERYNNNYKFIKTLVGALKIPHSFNYEFDSLRSVSILTSPDKKFKIFSWHLMNNDGSYRYYGTIQMNDGSEKLKLHPLIDNSALINKPADTATTNDKWFGAQYYKVIPVTQQTPIPYYILLGWKGNTVKTTKKVIEVLYFKDGKAYFGLPVFDGDKEHLGQKRIIFEYSRQVSMLLRYVSEKGTIVFDHLAAPDPKMKGKYEMYGPDMSYDGYKLTKGRWRYIEDLELKNDTSELDEQFNDPRNPKTSIKRKFIE